VRRAAWGAVQALLGVWKAQVGGDGEKEKEKEGVVRTLGTAILRSAWVEPDSLVQSAMRVPLLTFLKGNAIHFAFVEPFIDGL